MGEQHLIDIKNK